MLHDLLHILGLAGLVLGGVALAAFAVVSLVMLTQAAWESVWTQSGFGGAMRRHRARRLQRYTDGRRPGYIWRMRNR